jgi:hypothetical protein
LSINLKSNLNVVGVQRAVLWDAAHYSKLQRFFRSLRFYHYTDPKKEYLLSESFDDYIDAVYNDHHGLQFEFTGTEALDAQVHSNVITSRGAVGFVAILANTSDQFFKFMAMGTSSAPATIGQRQLGTEIARVSCDTDGALTARGNVLSQVGNFGYGAPTNQIYEFGGFNKDVDGDMYFRATLSDPLTHTQGSTFVSASHATAFIPVS